MIKFNWEKGLDKSCRNSSIMTYFTCSPFDFPKGLRRGFSLLTAFFFN